VTRFDPVPSLGASTRVEVTDRTPTDVDAIGVVVAPDGDIPPEIGLDRARLTAHGFRGALDETLVVPAAAAPTRVAVGTGDRVDGASLRSAAATFASAAAAFGRLARYRYQALRSAPSGEPLDFTILGGTTVEVMDTDAEGRVVMSDALVMARREQHDAVLDIATLTGAAMRALGTDIAALFGNHDDLVAQVERSSARTGELVWRLPLHRPYRSQLDSLTADFTNVGYGHAGAITAALFLAEFVSDTPWVHLGIAGPAQVDDGRSWLPAGCSGFGARLVADLAVRFTVPG
jgi:hypothetical protein